LPLNRSCPARSGNDGGPLLIAPQAAVAAWEGTDAPSNGRVVSAKFRWSNENDPASDYDRACDVDPQTAAAIDIGEHWGIIIGTAAAQSAHWLPGSDADEFYAVGIEAADDASPERLRALTSEATEWRLLRAQVSVATEGLLLAHAASRYDDSHARGGAECSTTTISKSSLTQLTMTGLTPVIRVSRSIVHWRRKLVVQYLSSPVALGVSPSRLQS